MFDLFKRTFARTREASHSNKVSEEATLQGESHLSEESLKILGLDPERLRSHESRIRAAVLQGKETWIPVVRTCTVNNGGIVPWKAAVRFLEKDRGQWERKFDQSSLHWWMSRHLVTFVPAAGAASRYLSKLHTSMQLLEGKSPILAKIYVGIRFGDKPFSLTQKDSEELQLTLGGVQLQTEIHKLSDHFSKMQPSKEKELFQSLLRGFLETLVKGSASPLASAGKADPAEREPFLQAGDTLESKLRRPWARFETKRSKDETKGTASASHSIANQLSHFVMRNLECYVALKVALELYAPIPKALVGTTQEGDTFLRLKLVEQNSLLPCAGTIVVAPDGQTQAFEKVIAKELKELPQRYINPFELGSEGKFSEMLSSQFCVLEQSRDLCTIRFDSKGNPLTSPTGEYSVVSAGHGELISLFDKVLDKYPSAECIHIRNIDNILGSTEERREELSIPAEIFRCVRDCLEYLRSSVSEFLSNPKTNGYWSPNSERWYLKDAELGKIAQFLLPLCGPNAKDLSFVQQALGRHSEETQVSSDSLHRFLALFFHGKPLPEGSSDLEKWSFLSEELSRPLSVFGVVRKETGDVGGGPVFVETGSGFDVKMCLEMPHANPEDSEEYFGARGKSTHFNPVLVFFELQTHCSAHKTSSPHDGHGKRVKFGQLFDERFWLLSKKEFQGQSVCYHETVLYELIGNAATSNLIFIEVPRTLFVPHKTIFDSLHKDRRSYGFHETLKET